MIVVLVGKLRRNRWVRVLGVSVRSFLPRSVSFGTNGWRRLSVCSQEGSPGGCPTGRTIFMPVNFKFHLRDGIDVAGLGTKLPFITHSSQRHPSFTHLGHQFDVDKSITAPLKDSRSDLALSRSTYSPAADTKVYRRSVYSAERQVQAPKTALSLPSDQKGFYLDTG
jgi:hypothetical protein